MRVLFFHQGRIRDWAGAILQGLKQQFPEADFLTFDLHALLKARRSLLLANGCAMAGRYGLDLLRRRRDLDDAFFTTGYLFHRVRSLSAEIHRKHPATFSFQMHSMHDHSFGPVPHFVYTDFTYESRKEFPVYGRYPWAAPRSRSLVRLERGIYERATTVFVQSQAVVNTLATRYGISRDKVLNVHYGPNIDIELLSRIPLPLERYKSKTVLFVGGNWVRKGGPELIRAFSNVRAIHPTARLVIVGCRPDVCAPGVDIIGQVPLAEIASHYRDAAVFCMPSKMEPSAAVYAEAMHAGLPVVALDLGAVRELVREGETGYLVKPDDINALANRISRLLSAPEECRRMGANGREAASPDYTWDRVFSQVRARVLPVISQTSVTASP